MSSIRIIAFAGDQEMVEYVQGLGHQLRTVRRRWYRTEQRDPLTVEVLLLGTAGEVLEALREPADLIVLASHGGFSDDGIAWVGENTEEPTRWLDLDRLRSNRGAGIRCHGPPGWHDGSQPAAGATGPSGAEVCVQSGTLAALAVDRRGGGATA